jgi:chromosome partitioning protein
MGVVLTIVNAKGGASKSTVALHLAAALAEVAPTILVDLDEANATSLDYAARGRLPYPVTTAADFEAHHARERWAHVVADAYPRPTDAQLANLVANTINAGGLLIIPTPPDGLSLRVLARFLPRVRAVEAPHRVLLTQVPPRPSRVGERALRDLTAGKVPVFATAIPRRAAFVNAARSCRLAWDVPGGRGLALVFDELAREVLRHART